MVCEPRTDDRIEEIRLVEAPSMFLCCTFTKGDEIALPSREGRREIAIY